MSKTPAIALTQLALWYDPTRLQTWPAFLAAVPEDAIAASPTDLGRDFATSRMTSQRHASAYNLVRNLSGLELRGDRLQLRGVGFVERQRAGYQLSARGRALAAEYVRAAEGSRWLTLLIDALIGREPRVRALVGLLSDRGASVEFERGGWFAGGYRGVTLRRPGCADLHPFVEADASSETLHPVLRDRPWWCLGDWREDPLLEGASDCTFTGLRSEAPSLHDIGLALRAALEALHVGGLVKSEEGRAWLDIDAAARVLPARRADFGWSEGRQAMDLVPALVDLLPALETPTGHVVASELRAALLRVGITDPDRAIAGAEEEGRLLVYAEDYGQGRHGRGLYGDPRKQLVKLRIVGGGA